MITMLFMLVFTLAACGSGTTSIETFELLNRQEDGAVAAYVDGSHWHGDLPDLLPNHHLSIGARIVDEDGEEITLDKDGHHRLRVELAGDANEGIVDFDHYGDHVHIKGVSEGITSVVFQWVQDGELMYETPSMKVYVIYADHNHDDEEVEAFELLNRREDQAVEAYVHGNHWHGRLPAIAVGENLSLGANIVDADGHTVSLGQNGHHTFKVVLLENANEGVVEFVNHGDHVHINAVGEGTTYVVFQWLHDGGLKYQTPPLSVEVTE